MAATVKGAAIGISIRANMRINPVHTAAPSPLNFRHYARISLTLVTVTSMNAMLRMRHHRERSRLKKARAILDRRPGWRWRHWNWKKRCAWWRWQKWARAVVAHYEVGTPLPTPTGPPRRNSTTAQLSSAKAERDRVRSRRPKPRVYYTDLTGI